jgi:protein ImuB
VSIFQRGVRGGTVDSCAGPWRTSGGWWSAHWDRDEWDVAIAEGPTYRLFRERHTDKWFLEAVVD